MIKAEKLDLKIKINDLRSYAKAISVDYEKYTGNPAPDSVDRLILRIEEIIKDI